MIYFQSKTFVLLENLSKIFFSSSNVAIQSCFFLFSFTSFFPSSPLNSLSLSPHRNVISFLFRVDKSLKENHKKHQLLDSFKFYYLTLGEVYRIPPTKPDTGPYLYWDIGVLSTSCWELSACLKVLTSNAVTSYLTGPLLCKISLNK